MLVSLFNKLVGLEVYNFIKKRFRHSCLPVSTTKIGVSFQYSLLKVKVYTFINREILYMRFSRAMIKRSKLQHNTYISGTVVNGCFRSFI